jgi:hypothetical protein
MLRVGVLVVAWLVGWLGLCVVFARVAVASVEGGRRPLPPESA